MPSVMDFDGIYSSDLTQAAESIKIALGLPNGLDIVKKDKRLREINYGMDEGKHFKSLVKME